MAEIQDTLGIKPKLGTYQAKSVRYKDPGQSRALNVPAVEAEMWNSVTKNLEKVFKINNDTKIAALDLEKNKIGAQIADHYREQEAYVLDNINKFKDQDLDTKAFFEKYDNGELEIKKFEYGKGHTDQSKEQMEAIKNDAEGRSKAKIRQILHQELVQRTGDMLDMKANRSINLLRNDLIEQERDFPEGFAQKYLINNKNQTANDYLKAYTKVLDTKLYGDMMDKKEKERRIYEYAQTLGNVLFEHYGKTDPEKAIELAGKREFKVGGITLDSAKVGQYILNQGAKNRSEAEAAKRLKYKVDLKELWKLNPKSFINMYSEQKDIERDGKVITLNVFRETSQRVWEKLGKKNGFKNKAVFDAVIKDAVLNAEGKHEQALKEQKTEKRRQDTENFDRMKTAIKEFTTADNDDTRDTFLHRHFIISDKEKLEIAGLAGKREQKAGYYEKIGKRWVVKPEYAQELAKSYNLDLKTVTNDLQKLVNGIPVRVPGSGMGTSRFSQFQSSLVDYYTKKLFVQKGEMMMKNPFLDTDNHKVGLMNEEEKKIYAKIKNGFEDILNFNSNEFTSKSSDTLLNDWAILESEHTTHGTGQETLALAMVGKRYKAQVLAKRVESLILRPNGTALKDLKIERRDFFDEPITPKEKKDIDDWYQELGQNREMHSKTSPPRYLPEYAIENLIHQLSSPLNKQLSEAEEMKKAYRESP